MAEALYGAGTAGHRVIRVNESGLLNDIARLAVAKEEVAAARITVLVSSMLCRSAQAKDHFPKLARPRTKPFGERDTEKRKIMYD